MQMKFLKGTAIVTKYKNCHQMRSVLLFIVLVVVGSSSLLPLTGALLGVGMFGSMTKQNHPFQKTTCLVLDRYIESTTCYVDTCGGDDAVFQPVVRRKTSNSCSNTPVDCYKATFEVNYITKDSQNVTAVFVADTTYTKSVAITTEQQYNVSHSISLIS